MAPLLEGTVGILPAGALGVSFFYHLAHHLGFMDGSVFFVERAGSPSAQTLRNAGEMLLADQRQIHRVPTDRILKPDLFACHRSGELPEVLLVCPNPDQLLAVIADSVALLERLHEQGKLSQPNIPLPIMVLSSNGIYFQRVRQFFIEKIEEATLLGHLPDLWPDLMPAIVGHLL